MVLITLVVIAVFGAAVLNQQSSAGNVQAAYAKVRDAEITADAALDSAIETIRYNERAGITSTVGSTGPCSSASPTPLKDAGNHDISYTGPNGEILEIYCAATTGSGKPVGDAGEPPPTPLVALGGVVGKGNGHENAGAASSTDPAAWVPFCNGWEDAGSYIPGGTSLYAGSPQCEAGIYIGATESDNDAGGARTAGLVVASNGALDPSAELVRSNGAISCPRRIRLGTRPLLAASSSPARSAPGAAAGCGTP